MSVQQKTEAARHLLTSLTDGDTRLVRRLGQWRLAPKASPDTDGRALDAALVESLLARGMVEAVGDTAALTSRGRRFAAPLANANTETPAPRRTSKTKPPTKQAMPNKPKARTAQESPLDWLRRRKGPDGAPLIGEAEYDAGERLRLDYARAGLMPRSGVDFEAGPQSGSGRGARGPVEVLDAALDARDRVNCALDHVGSDLSGMLVDVCCHLKSLGEVEAERGWPKRSAKVVLDIGLSRLARHYGLQSQAVGPRRAGKTRSWGGEGYRPEIG